jgi:hypothetical protein
MSRYKCDLYLLSQSFCYVYIQTVSYESLEGLNNALARYSTAEALRLIMQEDTGSDEDYVTEADADNEDGDYLPEYRRSCVRGVYNKSEDTTTSEGEKINEPSSTLTS